jgi:hypothetical protein
MRFFVDIESSGLSDGTYPIELGWTDEAGNTSSFLIKPSQEWLDRGVWDEGAEIIHGIGMDELLREGVTPEEAACRLQTIFSNHDVLVTSVPHDGYWLSLLQSETGREFQFNLLDFDSERFMAFLSLLKQALPGFNEDTLEHWAADFFLKLNLGSDSASAVHRAAEDSQAMYHVWTKTMNALPECLDKFSRSS